MEGVGNTILNVKGKDDLLETGPSIANKHDIAMIDTGLENMEVTILDTFDVKVTDVNNMEINIKTMDKGVVTCADHTGTKLAGSIINIGRTKGNICEHNSNCNADMTNIVGVEGHNSPMKSSVSVVCEQACDQDNNQPNMNLYDNPLVNTEPVSGPERANPSLVILSSHSISGSSNECEDKIRQCTLSESLSGKSSSSELVCRNINTSLEIKQQLSHHQSLQQMSESTRKETGAEQYYPPVKEQHSCQTLKDNSVIINEESSHEDKKGPELDSEELTLRQATQMAAAAGLHSIKSPLHSLDVNPGTLSDTNTTTQPTTMLQPTTTLQPTATQELQGKSDESCAKGPTGDTCTKKVPSGSLDVMVPKHQSDIAEVDVVAMATKSATKGNCKAAKRHNSSTSTRRGQNSGLPVKSKKTNACKECGLKFATPFGLKCHMLGHKKKTPFRCPQCSKDFKQVGSLKIHMRVHTGERPHKCPHCDKCVAQLSHLQVHIRSHTGEKPYTCSECKKTFAQSSSLTLHQRIHSGERPYSCKHCGKQFIQLGDCRRHEFGHTGRKPFMCPECGLNFAFKPNLKNHINRHKGLKPYVCTVCQKGCSDSSSLKRHARIHTGEKPYHCDICGKYFANPSSFTNHKRRHQGYKPHKCHRCGKKFITASDIKIHIRSHTGEKPYTCEHCQKSFSTKSYLIKHVRIHTGERPYSCEKCEKTFRQTSDLQKHWFVHTKEKPYICRSCGKGFQSSSNLKRHQVIHSGEKPYQCRFCGRHFTQNASVTLHMKKSCPQALTRIGQLTDKERKESSSSDNMKRKPMEGLLKTVEHVGGNDQSRRASPQLEDGPTGDTLSEKETARLVNRENFNHPKPKDSASVDSVLKIAETSEKQTTIVGENQTFAVEYHNENREESSYGTGNRVITEEQAQEIPEKQVPVLLNTTAICTKEKETKLSNTEEECPSVLPKETTISEDSGRLLQGHDITIARGPLMEEQATGIEDNFQGRSIAVPINSYIMPFTKSTHPPPQRPVVRRIDGPANEAYQENAVTLPIFRDSAFTATSFHPFIQTPSNLRSVFPPFSTPPILPDGPLIGWSYPRAIRSDVPFWTRPQPPADLHLSGETLTRPMPELCPMPGGLLSRRPDPGRDGFRPPDDITFSQMTEEFVGSQRTTVQQNTRGQQHVTSVSEIPPFEDCLPSMFL